MARFAKAAGQPKVSASAIMLALVAGLLFWNMALDQADAGHEPANKTASSAVSLVDFDTSAVLLSETMRVSSVQDLVLSVSAECSILTTMTVGGEDMATDSASAAGQVNINVTIDGTPVPISTFDQDAAKPGVQTDDGTVTFCEREDRQSVRDAEDPADDTDEERIYERTKSANSWNWLAIDVGKTYDDPANGNNIVEVVVNGYYDTTVTGRATADAYVGQRILVAEPTHASVHEQILPADESA